MMRQTIKTIKREGMRIAIIKNEDRMEIVQVDKNDKRIFGTDINIYKSDFIKDSKWEINWSGLGASSVATTKNYITLLALATELAEEENKSL